MTNIILFGPPGSGKGTQAEKLVDKYNLLHISTGDVFRYNIKNETELGVLAKSYMDKGELVPDEITIQMLISVVDKNPDSEGIIFDGFPRTIPQAKALDKILLERGGSISTVLALDVEEEELKTRLKNRALESGRPDDADPEIINNRISVYLEETFPLKAFYTEQGKCQIIDGQGSIDEITNRLFESLDSVII
jgi:adenylate kinase